MSETLYTKANIEITDKGMLAVASTSVVDRQGEIVSVDGWDLKNFKKNPVLLWAHNHDEVAIGKAKNIKVVGEGKKAQLVFEPVFHDKTPLAKAIKSLFEGDEEYEPTLNSFSVGFRPTDTDGNVYTKQELLEISAVNVPANPEARVMAYKSLKSSGTDDAIIKSLGIEIEEDSNTDLRAEIEDLKGKYEDLVKGLKHLNPSSMKAEILTQRMSLLKVVVRANDKILEKDTSVDQTERLAKIAKRATEKLIVEHKRELTKNGKS